MEIETDTFAEYRSEKQTREKYQEECHPWKATSSTAHEQGTRQGLPTPALVSRLIRTQMDQKHEDNFQVFPWDDAQAT